VGSTDFAYINKRNGRQGGAREEKEVILAKRADGGKGGKGTGLKGAFAPLWDMTIRFHLGPKRGSEPAGGEKGAPLLDLDGACKGGGGRKKSQRPLRLFAVQGRGIEEGRGESTEGGRGSKKKERIKGERTPEAERSVCKNKLSKGGSKKGEQTLVSLVTASFLELST